MAENDAIRYALCAVLGSLFGFWAWFVAVTCMRQFQRRFGAHVITRIFLAAFCLNTLVAVAVFGIYVAYVGLGLTLRIAANNLSHLILSFIVGGHSIAGMLGAIVAWRETGLLRKR